MTRSFRIHCHRPLLAVAFLFLWVALPQARAQWQSVTYSLKGGWNAIYLHGNATHATPDIHFPNTGATANVLEIWRWNPNPDQVQFTTSPLIPSEGTPEWSVWRRGQPAQSTLSQLTGQTAYLIKCAGAAADTYSIPIVQRPLPPTSTWQRVGANLLGFPTFRNGTTFPTLAQYFATFPAAIASNSKVYKYTGGDLGPANPIQVFAPASEPLDRNQAYWFEAEVTGNFYAPIEISPSNPKGLEFGRTGSSASVIVRNRTAATVTLTLAPVASAAAPLGQEAITGSVPLTRRILNTTTNQYEETPITGPTTEVLGPQQSRTLEFGINRASLTGASNALFASLLRFTDSSNLLDVSLPANARIGSMAGLWLGEIEATGVESKVAGSPGATTPRGFPLRYLLHVDDGGTARLLSQVFIGTLAAAPNPTGLCVQESALKADSKASAMRLVAAHMPLDRVLSTGTGSVALGATLSRTISLPYDDPVNPFVHQYHPDHDNRNPRLEPVGNKVESHTVNRTVNFEFLAIPPAGTPALGWGSTVLGGNYTETVSGLHKQPVQLTGSFRFRRISEIGAITLP